MIRAMLLLGALLWNTALSADEFIDGALQLCTNTHTLVGSPVIRKPQVCAARVLHLLRRRGLTGGEVAKETVYIFYSATKTITARCIDGKRMILFATHPTEPACPQLDRLITNLKLAQKKPL